MSTAGTIRACRRWSALRRRGYTPEAIRLFAERIGVSKSDSWIDMSVLEDCLRDDLNARAERRIAVLDPIKLVIDNYPEGRREDCFAPNHPQRPELGTRALPLTRELWIERDDFQEKPPKGYFRLSPGRRSAVALRLHRALRRRRRDAAGSVSRRALHVRSATRSGTPGAEARKVKGNIHWLSVRARAAARRCASTIDCSRCRCPDARNRRAPTRAPPRAAARTRSSRRRRRRRRRADRAQLSGRPESRLQARDRRATSSPRSPKAPARRATSSSGTATSSPICNDNAPRHAGVQPHGHAARFLGQGSAAGATLNRRASDARGASGANMRALPSAARGIA